MIRQNRQVDQILENYKSELKNDFTAYRGHCYRVFNFMKYLGLDQREEFVCSVLIPFHDIGIWTHNTMDYLDPSVKLAKEYVKKEQLDIHGNEIVGIILNHHKITSATSDLEEKLRKADLIDLTACIYRANIPQYFISEVKKEFPFNGFQRIIFRKVISHALRNLNNPLPMLRV